MQVILCICCVIVSYLSPPYPLISFKFLLEGNIDSQAVWQISGWRWLLCSLSKCWVQPWVSNLNLFVYIHASLISVPMEWVFIMNRMSSQGSSAAQRRRMALGVVILLLVDVIWVASSELTSVRTLSLSVSFPHLLLQSGTAGIKWERGSRCTQ